MKVSSSIRYKPTIVQAPKASTRQRRADAGCSHQPRQKTAIFIRGQETRDTLMALPMKVAIATC